MFFQALLLSAALETGFLSGGAGGSAGGGTTALGAAGGKGGNGWVLVEW